MMRLDRVFRSTLFRFLLVGGSFAVIYALLAAFVTSVAPWPKPLLAACVWLACIPPAFYCHRRFAFTHSRPHRHGLLLYVAAQCAGICIVMIASATLAIGVFWPDTLVYLGASALSAVVSYLITRFVIFPASVPERAALGDKRGRSCQDPWG